METLHFLRRIAANHWKDGIGIVLMSCIFVLPWTKKSAEIEQVEASISAVGGRVYRNSRDAVYALNVNNRSLDRQFFEVLPNLRCLESLSLSRSSFSSHGLRVLPELESLRTLSLLDTNASNAALRHVGDCYQLEVLSLDGTQVTSLGLANIIDLDSLRCLTLSRTRITDAVIDDLSKLTNLQQLDIRYTQLSPDGVAELRSRMPQCEINYVQHRRTGRRQERIFG